MGYGTVKASKALDDSADFARPQTNGYQPIGQRTTQNETNDRMEQTPHLERKKMKMRDSYVRGQRRKKGKEKKGISEVLYNIVLLPVSKSSNNTW